MDPEEELIDPTLTPTDADPIVPAPSADAPNDPTVDPTADPADPVDPAPADPVDPAAPVVDKPVDHQQPKPAERRIRSLIEENKRLTEENIKYSQSQTPSQQQAPKLSEQFKDKDTIDLAELDKAGEEIAAQSGVNVARLENAKLRFEMSQEKAVNQYENDGQKVEAKYPVLNPDNKDFNPKLDKLIADTWKKEAVRSNPFDSKLVQIDPSVRLTDIAARVMEAFDDVMEAGKSQASAALANQADSVSVQPSATPPKGEKKFEDMSIPEMEAHLRAKGIKV